MHPILNVIVMIAVMLSAVMSIVVLLLYCIVPLSPSAKRYTMDSVELEDLSEKEQRMHAVKR